MDLHRHLARLCWALLFLAILLQLATSREVPFGAAMLYSLAVVATFRLYGYGASRPATRQWLTARSTAVILLLAGGTAALLTLALAAQGYALTALLPAVGARTLLADPLPICCGLFILSSFVVGLHYLFERYRQAQAQEKAFEALQRRVLEMELHLLRHQLSPHFTFNVLNNLHFLIYKDQQEALQLLATYTQLLRYYTYESRKQTIPLRQEVAFLRAYFELQQKQRGPELPIIFDTTADDETFCIVPFLLTTFVENACKHVRPNAAGQHYIQQGQTLTATGRLTFALRNTCQEAPTSAPTPYSGLGLRHVQDSLALAYPGRHRLVLRQEAGVFHVHLELDLVPCHAPVRSN